MNTSRVILVNILVLLLLIGGGFAAFYYYNQAYLYVTTDNARVAGQQISIAAPGNGKITTWTGSLGKTFTAGQTIGSLQMAAAPGTPKAGTKPPEVNITVPAGGTIAQNNVVPNSMVAAGTPLAVAYDLDSLWISANVNETNLDNIKKDQDVDIYVDAYPGTTLNGTISQIGVATAGEFSLLPQQNSTANYTKVTQVVPVKISLKGYKGLYLIPGMSVTARIHIRE